MVLPFDRQPLLHKRYEMLDLPASEQQATRSPRGTGSEEYKGDEYANFLK